MVNHPIMAIALVGSHIHFLAVHCLHCTCEFSTYIEDRRKVGRRRPVSSLELTLVVVYRKRLDSFNSSFRSTKTFFPWSLAAEKLSRQCSTTSRWFVCKTKNTTDCCRGADWGIHQQRLEVKSRKLIDHAIDISGSVYV